jgi:hypothetical protein
MSMNDDNIAHTIFLGDDPEEEERQRELEEYYQWDYLRRGVLCRAALKKLEL